MDPKTKNPTWEEAEAAGATWDESGRTWDGDEIEKSKDAEDKNK